MLAGLSASSMDEAERSTEVSMEELAQLVDTAGGEVAAVVLQQRQTPDPRSFLGEGKVAELKEIVANSGCDLAVFDNELSPSQLRVLSEELGVKVLDRSGLILDIFAQRARTREGQLQVELAQYEYLLPRLTGMWTHLVRQTASGGSSPIGTRGPGETQLETDRRHIRRKIQKLREELEQVRKVRGVQRRRRERNAMPVVAIVGYTNAGKSTLLNTLTGSDIPANDRLFDTLDTTTRRLKLDEAQEALISDTVGFIRKLPTHLVEAFKATLEELQYADVLLHVIDISSEDMARQIEVVEDLIVKLGAGTTPCIRVYNKCDRYLGVLPRGGVHLGENWRGHGGAGAEDSGDTRPREPPCDAAAALRQGRHRGHAPARGGGALLGLRRGRRDGPGGSETRALGPRAGVRAGRRPNLKFSPAAFCKRRRAKSKGEPPTGVPPYC